MIRFDNLPPEVMQAMCTPMHLILPASAQQRTGALYLGSFSAILDPGLLGAQGIKLESHRLNILDSSTADLRPHLEAAVRWIDDRLRCGVNVLVRCQQVRLRLRLRPQRAPLPTQTRGC